MRFILVVLLCLSSFLTVTAVAGCPTPTAYGQTVTCTDQASASDSAAAYSAANSDATCQHYYGPTSVISHGPTTGPQFNPDGSGKYSGASHCDANSQLSLAWFYFPAPPASACSINAPNLGPSTITYPAGTHGSTTCSNGCSYIANANTVYWNYANDAQHWATSADSWTPNGQTCTASATAPTPSDPATQPPVKDPQNPNPPPVQTPATPTPTGDQTPPPPANAAVNGAIEQLGTLLGVKLDAVDAALLALNQSVNFSTTTASAQASQNTAQIVSAINAAGHGTDMGPTNALLAIGNTNTGNIKSNTDSLSATGSPPDPYADGGPADATGVAQDVGSSTDSSTQLDQSGFGWSRACPANPTFSVFGHSYSIDMSNICTIGGVLGNLLVLLTLLAAARIATSST